MEVRQGAVVACSRAYPATESPAVRGAPSASGASDELSQIRMSANPRRARGQVGELAEAELAARVRADRCDVLVELTGHTAGNRLGALAMRPAPVQARPAPAPRARQGRRAPAGPPAQQLEIGEALAPAGPSVQPPASALRPLPGAPRHPPRERGGGTRDAPADPTLAPRAGDLDRVPQLDGPGRGGLPADGRGGGRARQRPDVRGGARAPAGLLPVLHARARRAARRAAARARARCARGGAARAAGAHRGQSLGGRRAAGRPAARCPLPAACASATLTRTRARPGGAAGGRGRAPMRPAARAQAL